MNNVYSYNQLVFLYGKDDPQVVRIKAHLLGISGGVRIDEHNATLEAFKRVNNDDLSK